MAHNERWRDREGQKRERVTWVTCAVFGEARVRALAPRLTKGVSVVVTGQLRANIYEVDGQKHEGLQIIVDDLVWHETGTPFDAPRDDDHDHPADTSTAARDTRAQGHRAARGGRR